MGGKEGGMEWVEMGGREELVRICHITLWHTLIAVDTKEVTVTIDMMLHNFQVPWNVTENKQAKGIMLYSILQIYYGRFKVMGIDTLSHFKKLSEESLDMLDVKDEQHRLKLLTARDIIKDPDRGL